MTAREGRDDEWDLVVVGAGPAGSTAALAALKADPTLRVLLLDRAELPRDKCCGDGIAPHVVDVLRSLGAADVVRDWAPLRRLEIGHGRREAVGVLTRPAWVIPRTVFDARLAGAAVAAGAVLRRRRVSSVRRRGDGLVVDGSIRAKVVIGADGAHSAVRSSVRVPDQRAWAFALRGYAPTAEHRGSRQVIRFGDGPRPSYAWAFDRGDGLSNVGYGELLEPHGAARAPSRSRMLELLDELIPGAGAEATDWRGHHLPLSGGRWHQPDGPTLLVGDAAGLVNPLTGEGIYYAVATGALAGRAAARAIGAGTPGAAGAAYRSQVRRLLARHLRHTWLVSRLARRPQVLDAGLRAAAHDALVFDDLVEIGLGNGRVTTRLAAGLAVGLIRPRPVPAEEGATSHADPLRPRGPAGALLPAGGDH